jgi:hypothetical protein
MSPFGHNHLAPSPFYRTHAIRQPLGTHYRIITCQEAQCTAYHNGWVFEVKDIDPDMAAAIKASGKRYQYVASDDGDTLVFAPGQECFAVHRRNLDREAFFYTGRGDQRTFTPRNAQQLRSGLWVEHFEEHLDKIKTELEKG